MKTQDHEWTLLFGDLAHRLDTCIHCGLFRLKTISSVFYLVQWSENYSQCRTFPYER